jgi:hypothetical protein
MAAALAAAVIGGMVWQPSGAESASVACNSSAATSKTLSVGIVRLTGCFPSSSAEEQTSLAGREFILNGFRFVFPDASGQVRVNTKTRQIDTTKPVRVVNLPGVVSQAPATRFSQISLSFVAPLKGEMSLGQVQIVPAALGGLIGIQGDSPLTISDGGAGSAEVAFKLPGILTLIDKEQSGRATFKTREDGAQVELDGIEINLQAGLKIAGLFGLDNASAVYSRSQNSWNAEGTILFPWATASKDFGVVGGFGITNGRIPNIKLGVDGVNKPIGNTGAYLQRIVGALNLEPVRFAAEIGATAGPKVKLPVLANEVAAVRVDGNIAIQLPFNVSGKKTTDPGYLSLGGRAKVLNVEAGKFDFRITFDRPPLATARFAIGIGLPEFNSSPRQPFFIGGEVQGWFQGTAFSVDGLAALRLFNYDVAKARAVLSNIGVAACAKVLFWEIGGGYAFASRKLEAFKVNQCGIARFRNNTRAQASVAAAGATDLRITPRDSIIKLVGESDVPSFSLRSDDGRTIVHDSSTGEPTTNNRDYLVLSDEANDTAYALVGGEADTWKLTPARGSSPIRQILRAKELPQPRIRAHVVGTGRKRTLHWDARRIPGQTLRFLENIDGVEKPLFGTKRAAGSRDFTPAAEPPGRRTLTAQIIQRGAIRREVKLDRYRLKEPRRPESPSRVRAQRLEHDVVVWWDRARGAKRYVVMVRDADGNPLAGKEVAGGQRKASFVDVPATDRMTAKVFAVGATDRVSKPGSDSFRTTGFPKGRRAALDELLASASRRDDRIVVTAPCPARGHCSGRIELVENGRVIATGRLGQVPPETLSRVILEAPGSGSVKIRAVLRQRGTTVHGSRVVEDAHAGELSE